MKTHDAFEFTAANGKGHPYDSWLDGNVNELTQGEDYAGKTPAVRIMIRKAAEKRGVGVRLQTINEGNGLMVQACPKGEENAATATAEPTGGRRKKS